MDKTSQIYQPFFNSKEFDRSARKIKLRLRTKARIVDEYNFMIFLLKEEVSGFLHYCQSKNDSYAEDRAAFDCTFRSTFSAGANNKINLFVFTEEACQDEKPEIIDYGLIKVFKSAFPIENDMTRVVEHIGEKIAKMRKTLIDA